MMDRWYKQFFCSEYWKLALDEYCDSRNLLEINYLLKVLKQHSASTVIDLGSGLGRHAIPLAKNGFSVIGYDVSEWVVERATQISKKENTDITWKVKDLLFDPCWDLAPHTVDAAISIQSFGWGSDKDQLIFLKKIHEILKPEGVLILDFSNLSAILSNYIKQASTVINNIKYEFNRIFCPITNRSRGSISIYDPSGEVKKIYHDIRLYTPNEILQLVRKAGFHVKRLDGDFTINQDVTMHIRYAQIIATPLPAVPNSLAIYSYVSSSKSLEKELLDLRWSPDEEEWLNVPPASLWEKLKQSSEESIFSWEALRFYPLLDPYNGLRSAPVISKFFNCDISPQCIFFSSGVSSLLYNLSHLAENATLLSFSLNYPDFSAWCLQKGAVLKRFSDENFSVEGLINQIYRGLPFIVHLEHPSITGHMIEANELLEICQVLQKINGILILDESNANYLEPSVSHVPLIKQTHNLIVLRGLSKGYVAGGLRVAYAVASESIGKLIQQNIPPMQTSELSFKLALALLNLGDNFEKLRTRVKAVKPKLIKYLQGIDIKAMDCANLPWLLLKDDNDLTFKKLLSCQIQTKRLIKALNEEQGKQASSMLKIAVPLSQKREQQLDTLFFNNLGL